MRHAARAGAVLLAALATLTACTSSTTSTSPAAQSALEALVLTLPPGGYQPGPSGPLDSSAAAQATVVPPGRMRDFLDGHPLRAGYSRVWTSGAGAYLTVVALSFDSAAAARSLVTAAIDGLRAALGTYFTKLAGVPGGVLYDLSGQQRVSRHYLFCSGAWFAVAASVYAVTECSKARPMPITAVVPYARLQYQQATKPAH